MIKNNLKIKENITLENIRDAVECVVSYAFKYGIYTPYYVETGKIVAVVRYLISGLQLEEKETEYTAYLLDGQVRNIVNNYIAKDPHNIFLNARDNSGNLIDKDSPYASGKAIYVPLSHFLMEFTMVLEQTKKILPIASF